MDFALEVTIAILVIGGHFIAALSFRIRCGAPIKCEICNKFLNGRDQWDLHQKSYPHYKMLKKRKRQLERDRQAFEELMISLKRARRCEAPREDKDLPWSALVFTCISINCRR